MSHVQPFIADISGIELPAKFTFPFYYEPHPLTQIAAQELQSYLTEQTDFKHNFGLDEQQDGSSLGKMFGVLVVQTSEDELGYLAAFSGKLADESLPPKFVPPVYNVHAQNSFFKEGERELDALNQQIKDLEQDPHFIEAQQEVAAKTALIDKQLQRGRQQLKASKKDRKIRREQAEQALSPKAFVAFNKKLAEESIKGQLVYKQMARQLKHELLDLQKELDVFISQIAALKSERKRKSAHLQEKIFNSYQFLNQQKIRKRLTAIFPNFREQQPPAGAGDCTAPKLLQYAFTHDLRPIAMGEFWWGVSPKTEIRKHQHFYPACGGRCKPILAHMLDGIEMDENPFLTAPTEEPDISIIYEDDELLVVSKPAEFLSVPGKELTDSVYTRIKAQYPEATGPMMVHRLDMSTSGLLVIAKTKEAHKILQSQFLNRTVKKRYVALLDGIIEQNDGYIDLPLRVDLDDRPRQLVCYEYGKPAKTRWKVVERSGGQTRVHLYPITGRTHQLRVHCSHSLGLNTPIVGDDLYGKKADRLYLHAEFIEFRHPSSEKKMRFTLKAAF